LPLHWQNLASTMLNLTIELTVFSMLIVPWKNVGRAKNIGQAKNYENLKIVRWFFSSAGRNLA
jgi:hypothetical protein